ncbi:tryptophan 7-halogenase [Sphingomonas sp. HF-S3]|uniref:Tryptophan 7-halogenase n=1 Tax=Sphingomonas rustica TaxID=3103142 RepID=A0ABV0B2W5_9SPHN
MSDARGGVMTLDEPMRSVAIIGGGIVGWSAAVALKRRVPALQVSILPIAVPPNALADRVENTLPSIIGFHDDLGLREDDAVLRAGSSWRLGTRFEGWAQGLPPYVHAYGPYGRPFGTASFHHHWVRAARMGTAAPYDTHSPAAMLANAGRLVGTEPELGSIFADIQIGLVLDLERYRAMLRAFAAHLGVVIHEGVLSTVQLRSADGFIGQVILEHGGSVEADLFIDASGPDGLLRDTIDAEWEDWTPWLRNDRLVRAVGPGSAPAALDHVTALAGGWRWRTSAIGKTIHGLCYSSAALEDEDARRLLVDADATDTATPVAFSQGCRTTPWARNCVAIGDAATVIEPLEWTNLHLAHSAIDRIVSMMTGRDCHPLEIADYNRQAGAEVSRVRDFVLCHYGAARRPEPFWQSRAELPESLARTLELFTERGRLPFFEEETFSRDSWLAILLGQGVIPRRVDALIEATRPDHSDAAMAGFRTTIERELPRFPTATDHHAVQMRRISR